MSAPERDAEDVDLLSIAINSLAWKTLNETQWQSSESTEDAIDYLAEWIRKSALALTAALLDVAKAIRERP